jgi:hypothetical protein
MIHRLFIATAALKILFVCAAIVLPIPAEQPRDARGRENCFFC